MGGGTGQNKVVSGQAPKEQRTHSMETYFSQNSGDKISGPSIPSVDKMAAEQMDMEGVADLQQSEATIIGKLTETFIALIRGN